jgi:hypothetical protein
VEFRYLWNMSRFRVAALLSLIMTMGAAMQAQSLRHTTWKAYFLPINDSVSLRWGADSMTVRTDSGTILLQSTYKDSANLVTLDDYGGQNACPNFTGTYRIKISADTLIMILDYDRCDLRSGTLMAKWWVRVPEPPKAAAVKKKQRGRG